MSGYVELVRGRERGQWWPVLVDEYTHPRWTVVVVCLECGAKLFARNHTIAPDGVVSPSLGHPEGAAPCGWHHHVKLIGWAAVPDAPEARIVEVVPFSTCARCGKQEQEISGWGTWGNPGIICRECRRERNGDHRPPPATPEEPRRDE